MCRLRDPSLKIFAKWIIFQISLWKKINCCLSKISLHSLTASWLEASSFSRNVQLAFRWSLEMSHQQNDWFARGSDSLSNSLSTMCTRWELSQRKFFASQQISILNIVKNFIVVYLKLAHIIKLWLIRASHPFTNSSVGLQLDHPHLRSTTWLVRKAIWQFEELPDYPMYKPRAPSLKIFSK